MSERTYIAIDLKSYYASLEAVERGLNPLTTNLVVADPSRTEKTICLAVSPSLKAYGIPGRARLFEVIQRVREINAGRLSEAIRQHKAVRSPDGSYTFSGKSWDAAQLAAAPSLALDYIVATPQMAHYMDGSARIYGIYLKYVAPEDIHVYSIDEVFIDATAYLDTYGLNPAQLAKKIIKDVLSSTGITATAGIGSNLYLAKVALDIMAKHVRPDEDGVRIAMLTEFSYRKYLWTHEPLTDFWRVGKGYAKKLAERGIYTMGDIARCSMGKPTDYYNEELLYNLFGVNAELLIDHAWGWEPCTMEAIKAYPPENNSIGSGQVLQSPYPFEKAKLVLREMTDMLALELVDKGMVTDQIVLTIGYDRENLSGGQGRKKYQGQVTEDRYGRAVPKHAHGTGNLETYTSSGRQITNCAVRLFDQIVDRELLVRRITIYANHVVREADRKIEGHFQQMSLFEDHEKETAEKAQLEREKKLQLAMLDIKKKFGKNAVLKGISLEEGATGRERNNQIGGHKA